MSIRSKYDPGLRIGAGTVVAICRTPDKTKTGKTGRRVIVR